MVKKKKSRRRRKKKKEEGGGRGRLYTGRQTPPHRTPPRLLPAGPGGGGGGGGGGVWCGGNIVNRSVSGENRRHTRPTSHTKMLSDLSHSHMTRSDWKLLRYWPTA
ncbi:putative ATP-dependent RNA helicase DHX57 [Thunnus albacares]|uniref:putative ATP-dependent RNA helicase DHX57 n=1 Tax=Thunnus albacares TaxID=8236 RepID=UPI001CF69643|nr:putative ATP-dependent RNA helicase DHX57 [Thunnus albacares]